MDEPITHSETEITPAIRFPEIPVEFQPDTTRHYREKNNTAVLWQENKDGRTYDFSGDATIDGKVFWVIGWSAFKKNGERYLKLYFKRIKSEYSRWDRNYAKASRAKHRSP